MTQFSSEFIASLLTNSDAERQEFLSHLQNDESDPKDNEHFQSIVRERFVNRIGEVKELVKKESGKDGFANARNKTVEDYQKHVAAQLPGFSSDSKNKDWFTEALSFAKSSATPTEKIVEVELTKETALKNPVVLGLIQEKVLTAQSESKDSIATLQNEITAMKTQQKDNVLRGVIAVEAEKSGIIRPDMDQAVKDARTQTLLILAKQKASDFKIDGKEVYPLDESGNIMQDELSFPVTMSKFIVEEVNQNGKLFTPHKHDPNKQAPNIQQEQRRTPNSSKAFKDYNDYMSQSANEADPQKRAEMKASYEAQEAQS